MGPKRSSPVKRRPRASSKSRSKSPVKKQESPAKSARQRSVKNPEKLRRDTPHKPRDIPYIGTQKDAPKWMRYNEYIWYGYRINFNTKMRAFKSLFIWNNQLGANNGNSPPHICHPSKQKKK